MKKYNVFYRTQSGSVDSKPIEATSASQAETLFLERYDGRVLYAKEA